MCRCASGEISVGQATKFVLPFYGALMATMKLVIHVPASSP
jgi:hypothetical protein